MRNLVLVVVGLLALSSSLTAQVYIQEYCNDPLGAVGIDPNMDGVLATSGSQSDDEFVELVNESTGLVDLSGWTLADGFSVRHTFAAGTLLPAGAAIVVFGGGDVTNFNANGAGAAVVADTGSLGLNNSSDTITLADAGGVVIATASYSSGGPGDGNGESVTRNPENSGGTFGVHSLVNGLLHSAGYQNDGVTPYLPAILPAPVVPAYPGNLAPGELDIDWDTNGASDDTADDIHVVNGGDVIGLQITSPSGNYEGFAFLLAISPYTTGATLSPISVDPLEAPSLWLDLSTVFFAIDGISNAGTLGAPVIGPGLGYYFSTTVPAALAGTGTSFMVQTVIIAPGLNASSVGITYGHEGRIN